MTNARVTMYLKRVTVKVKDGTDQGLNRLAQQIAGLTKVAIQRNGQIDTGFMLSSVYAIGKGQSGYSMARAEALAHNKSRRTGRRVTSKGRMAPERELLKVNDGDSVAGIVVGANYAIFQEARRSFLYVSAEAGARQAGGTLEAEYRKVVRD